MTHPHDSYPLAVFNHHVGARSETFIRRHMLDLLPGRTAIVAETFENPADVDWSIDAPRFDPRTPLSNRLHPQLIDVAAQRIARSRFFMGANLRRFLRDHRVEVCLAEYLDLAHPWFQLVRGSRIRFFVHAHGKDVSSRLRDEDWRVKYRDYGYSAGIITMSELSKARLIDLGLPAETIFVIPYGVDVPSHPIRRAESDRVRCFAVGRMVAKKAPLLLIEVFSRAAEKNPALELDYVGEGPLLEEARAAAANSPASDRIRLHGGCPHARVIEFLQRADIFLQHSIVDPETGDEEGLPVSILEAMAHALPVISTRHAGIPEAVIQSETGYLVEEGNTGMMTDYIKILASNRDVRIYLGENGHRRALERFSWERERADLLRVLGLESHTTAIPESERRPERTIV